MIAVFKLNVRCLYWYLERKFEYLAPQTFPKTNVTDSIYTPFGIKHLLRLVLGMIS